MKEKLDEFIVSCNGSDDCSVANFEQQFEDELSEGTTVTTVNASALGGFRLIRLIRATWPSLVAISGDNMLALLKYISDNWDEFVAIIGDVTEQDWFSAVKKLIELVAGYFESRPEGEVQPTG